MVLFWTCKPEVLTSYLTHLTVFVLPAGGRWRNLADTSDWAESHSVRGNTRGDSRPEHEYPTFTWGQTETCIGSGQTKLPWWQSWAAPVAWSNVSVTVRAAKLAWWKPHRGSFKFRGLVQTSVLNSTTCRPASVLQFNGSLGWRSGFVWVIVQ